MIATRSTEKIEHIYSRDPALDAGNPSFDWQRFLETGDRKHVPIKEGFTPTVFLLQRLTRKQLTRVLEASTAEHAAEAVSFALKGIKDWGAPLDFKFAEARGDLGQRVHPETIEKIFAIDLFAELGQRILELSKLDPSVGQG